jgi:hypothetical protein
MAPMSVTASLGRPTDRMDRLRLALAQIGLPAWFVVIDLLWVVKPITLAIDARHYQRAASTWLAGGNPWAVYEYDVPYLSGPHTLLFYAPTSVLPLTGAVVTWMLVGFLAAVWVVRRLGLPMWWIAFPPLFHAIWNGNPQTLMLALLMVGTPIASSAAAAIKLYAFVPLLFRPTQLLVAGIVVALTLPLFPWHLYLASGSDVSDRLMDSWNGSAWRIPVLLVPTLLALWVLRKRGAEWWSIPAVWPATQFYYVSTVLPVVARRPVLAALTALPVPLMVPIIVMGLALVHALGARPGVVIPAWIRRVIEPDGDALRAP